MFYKLLLIILPVVIVVLLIPIFLISQKLFYNLGTALIRFLQSISKRLRPAVWPSLSGDSVSNFRGFLAWSGYGPYYHWLLAGVLSGLIVAVALVFLNYSGSGILLLLLMGGSGVIIFGKARDRQKKFVRQLPDALKALTDLLRAGYSLPAAIALVAEEIDEPLNMAWRALARAESWRLDWPTAVGRLNNCIKLPEWAMVSEALTIITGVAGAGAALLDQVAEAIQDRLTLGDQIKSLTAAGRLSGILVAALFPIVLIFFWILSPAYVAVLFDSLTGRILFGVALGLEVVGWLWIRRIIRWRY